jgi:parallel beta-helix repeat protein
MTSQVITEFPATYYVATNGSDNNAGTIDQPFATLQHAVNQIKDGAGGNIYLRGGVYDNAGGVWINGLHDGSATSRLVIQPYQNEAVLIEANSTAAAIAVGGDYVDIIGLEVRNSKQGIIGWGAHNLRILNNIIHDVQDTGIASYAPDVFGAGDILVDGNTVYRTNLSNQGRQENGAWGSGITMSRTQNAVVTNNLVYENWGEGITATLSDNVRVANNVVYDNYSVQLYLDNATNTIFENNLAYDTGNTAFDRQYGSAAGIQIASEPYGAQNLSGNNTIRNNIIINAGVGLAYGSYSVGGGIHNTQIIHNTFYGSERGLLDLGTAFHDNVTIANNIFHGGNNPLISTWVQAPQGVTLRNNLWNKAGSGVYGGTGDIIADPKFANAGGTSAQDYQIQTGSLAIDAALGSLGLSLDFFGQSRDWATDIGATEYRTPLDTLAPSATLANAAVSSVGTQLGYDLQIIYSDDTALQFTSLDSSDLIITGPLGETHTARLVTLDASANGPDRQGLYRLEATALDQPLAPGRYTVGIAPNQVWDTTGNSMAPQEIGSFEIPPASPASPASPANPANAPTPPAPITILPSSDANLVTGLIDLTSLTRSGASSNGVRLTLSDVSQDGRFQDSIGLYVAQSASGAVLDATTGRLIQPGESGYTAAALSQRIADSNLSESSTGVSFVVPTGTYLAPYLVVQGTVQDALSNLQSPGTQTPGKPLPEVFFGARSANRDAGNHIQAQGSWLNFEDLGSSGDQDFNDFRVKVSLAWA